MLAFLAACSEPQPPPQTAALVPAGPVTAAPVPDQEHGNGAVVYVPAWSSVYVGDGNKRFDLTVTLAVRNTDRRHPITVRSVRYYDSGGRELHAFVEAPTPIGPLASASTVVSESDTRAGVGGSFLVEWTAAEDVSEPIIEAVMIGSSLQQGISLIREGQVVERLTAPRP